MTRYIPLVVTLFVLTLSTPLLALDTSLHESPRDATRRTATGSDQSEALFDELARARKAGDRARTEEILELLSTEAGNALELPPGAAFSVTSYTRDLGSLRTRGEDILVGDQSDVDGFCDLVSTASGEYFLIVEGMDSNELYLYRSDTGGESWWLYNSLNSTADMQNPSIAVPEYREDHVFVVFEQSDLILVWRIDLVTGGSQIDPAGVSSPDVFTPPRIVTDNHDYYNYFVYISYDVTKLARSPNQGATWWDLDPVNIPNALALISSDIAYGNDVLYLTQSYVPAGDAGSDGAGWSRVQASTNEALSWDHEHALNGLSCRVGAIQDGDVVMAVSFNWEGNDNFIEYAYSLTNGLTWYPGQQLDYVPGEDRLWPDICVDPSANNFHVVYWATGHDIIYRTVPHYDLPNWSPPRIINDTSQASNSYLPPTAAVDWTSGAAGIAWSDSRTPTYATYFDRTDGPIGVSPDGSQEYDTVQDGVDAAQEGDTVELEDGIYTGVGNRDVDYHGKGVTVRSRSGDPTGCIVDCQGSARDQHRGFYFHSGEGPDAVLENVTIYGGYHAGGGAIMCDGASPTVAGCLFLSNGSSGDGGAVYCTNGAAPLLTECTFAENDAGDDGGGLQCRDNAAAELNTCTFFGNSANDAGGALYCTASGHAILSGCTITDNYAPGPGAGMSIRSGSSITLENTIITFNGNGAAVHCSGGSATLTCCDVYGNAGGDWVGCIAGQYDINGNISLHPLFCGNENPAEPYTLHSNSPCAPESNPACGLIGAWPVGCGASSEVAEWAVGESAGLYLAPSAPNPFTLSTQITYWIPQRTDFSPVLLDIHDPAGRVVRRFIDAPRPGGSYQATWDGRDQTGRPAPAGVYFYRLSVGGETVTRRILLVR